MCFSPCILPKRNISLTLRTIKIAAGIDENCQDDVVSVPREKAHGGGVWKELLLRPTPSVRWILTAAVGLHFFEHATGIEAVILYGPRIFKKAGIIDKDKLLLATIGVGLTKVGFLIIATFLLDRMGRKRLLLYSTGGMICALAVLGFSLTIADHSKGKVFWALVLSIVATYSYVACFNFGLGPVTWVYSSEIFPLKLRAQGASIGVAMNRLMNAVVSMTFISIYKAITIGGAFFMFCGISVIAWVFFFMFLPETKGKSLEEIDMLFTKNKSSSSRDNNVDASTEMTNDRVVENV